VLALAALMISLPLLAWEIAAGEVIWPDLRGFAILLYVTLFPSLLSQIFFMRGVELIGPGRAGLFVNLPVAVPQELPTVLAQNANDCRREIVHADTLGESTDMTVGLPGVWRVENSEGQALSFWNQAPF
jgi:hypothetical protein